MFKHFKILLLLLIPTLTACQQIEQAIDETFAENPTNKTQAENKGGIFGIDLSSQPVQGVYFMDFINDAREKMGFQFSTETSSALREYITENNIGDYLTEEEIIEVFNSMDSTKVFADPNLLDSLRAEIFQMTGTEDVEFLNHLYINKDRFYTDIVVPSNREISDIYDYCAWDNKWNVSPNEGYDYENDKKYLYPLKNVSFKAMDKIYANAATIFYEMENLNEYAFEHSDLGIDTIYGRYYRDEFFYYTIIKGTRYDLRVSFDQEGNVIEKEKM